MSQKLRQTGPTITIPLLLPPRQEEIYAIIKEHRFVSFDFLRRRFFKVPARTLRYDLKKLTDKNYILKIGQTKGSYYRVLTTQYPDQF